jgi:hypothetical protein
MTIEQNPLHAAAGHGRRPILFGVGVLIVILLASVIIFGALDDAWFHEDEAGWISAGYHYSDALLAGDFSWRTWACPECHAWGSLNMPLGKLLIGLPLRLYSNANRGGEAFFGLYDGSRSHAENVADGRVPPADILQRGREAAAVFGVLTCVLLFVLGYYLAGWLAGLLAVGLTLANNTFIYMATQAMTDIHYNFFLLAVCLASGYYVAQATDRRRLWAGLAAGILTGLACSVKITGLAIGAALFAGLVVYSLALRRITWRVLVRDSIVFGLAALAVIYLLNPVFWLDFSPGSASPEPGIPQHIVAIWDPPTHPPQGLARLAEFPRLFVRWNALMASQQNIGKWTGPRGLVIQQQTFVGQISFPIEALFLLAGFVFCIYQVARCWQRRQITRLVVPPVYFLVNYLLLLGFLQLNWPRYYLPVEIAINMLAAIGVVAVLTSGLALVRRALAGSAH